MHKNLVIVESPAKAKTIEKFLGKDYTVMSSFGHIRDLEDKEFGNIAKNFTPKYVVPSDKKKLVSDLKKVASDAEMVWLASDEDREGEAIAWHLYEVLKLNPEKSRRIVFHEITKNAIIHAIETPRTIDINLVDAQQARRVLDRIVGFELSPVLWRKIKPALSAGRVQSVAVRLIVERERDIQNFIAEASFRVTALFKVTDTNGTPVELKAELKNRFNTLDEARTFLEQCKTSSFSIDSIDTRPAKKSPAPPFTTSTLQQEAARKFGYPVATTMRIAQKLYESGLITYMRTDSVNLSSLAIATTKEEIINIAGENYLKIRSYQTKSKGAQEAHEAIRPTYMSTREISGSAQEKRLYELIWKRTIASQMADAELERTNINISISGSNELFVATGEVLKFDGFLKVYLESTDEEETNEESSMLPPLTVNQPLSLSQAIAQERFTQKPARYTEASLVRKLEELGIGRPSTYAPTISTIQNREYVDKREMPNEVREYAQLTLKKGAIKEEVKADKATIDKGKLVPTDIGIVVNDYLIDNFPNIMDYNFTARVEEEFDEIAEGKSKWKQSIADFYAKFHPSVEAAASATNEKKVGERELGIDPKSGKPLFVKIGRFGPVAQIGLASDEEKPRFAALRKDQSLETITLDEALELFKLPLDLGIYESDKVTVAIGKFGPYVKYGKNYVSIPKEQDPLEMTLEKAIKLIEAKKQADKNKEIKLFTEADIAVLNGRYGAYIAHGGNNYKLPKSVTPSELTLEECQQIIASQPQKEKKSFKKKK